MMIERPKFNSNNNEQPPKDIGELVKWISFVTTPIETPESSAAENEKKIFEEVDAQDIRDALDTIFEYNLKRVSDVDGSGEANTHSIDALAILGSSENTSDVAKSYFNERYQQTYAKLQQAVSRFDSLIEQKLEAVRDMTGAPSESDKKQIDAEVRAARADLKNNYVNFDTFREFERHFEGNGEQKSEFTATDIFASNMIGLERPAVDRERYDELKRLLQNESEQPSGLEAMEEALLKKYESFKELRKQKEAEGWDQHRALLYLNEKAEYMANISAVVSYTQGEGPKFNMEGLSDEQKARMKKDDIEKYDKFLDTLIAYYAHDSQDAAEENMDKTQTSKDSNSPQVVEGGEQKTKSEMFDDRSDEENAKTQKAEEGQENKQEEVLERVKAKWREVEQLAINALQGFSKEKQDAIAGKLYETGFLNKQTEIQNIASGQEVEGLDLDDAENLLDKAIAVYKEQKNEVKKQPAAEDLTQPANSVEQNIEKKEQEEQLPDSRKEAALAKEEFLNHFYGKIDRAARHGMFARLYFRQHGILDRDEKLDPKTIELRNRYLELSREAKKAEYTALGKYAENRLGGQPVRSGEEVDKILDRNEMERLAELSSLSKERMASHATKLEKVYIKTVGVSALAAGVVLAGPVRVATGLTAGLATKFGMKMGEKKKLAKFDKELQKQVKDGSITTVERFQKLQQEQRKMKRRQGVAAAAVGAGTGIGTGLAADSYVAANVDTAPEWLSSDYLKNAVTQYLDGLLGDSMPAETGSEFAGSDVANSGEGAAGADSFQKPSEYSAVPPEAGYTESAAAAESVSGLESVSVQNSSEGAIQTILDLKTEFARANDISLSDPATYPEGLSEQMRNFLNTSSIDLAQQYGLYDPSQAAESAMMLEGTLTLNPESGIVYDPGTVGGGDVQNLGFGQSGNPIEMFNSDGVGPETRTTATGQPAQAPQEPVYGSDSGNISVSENAETARLNNEQLSELRNQSTPAENLNAERPISAGTETSVEVPNYDPAKGYTLQEYNTAANAGLIDNPDNYFTANDEQIYEYGNNKFNVIGSENGNPIYAEQSQQTSVERRLPVSDGGPQANEATPVGRSVEGYQDIVRVDENARPEWVNENSDDPHFFGRIDDWLAVDPMNNGIPTLETMEQIQSKSTHFLRGMEVRYMNGGTPYYAFEAVDGHPVRMVFDTHPDGNTPIVKLFLPGPDGDIVRYQYSTTDQRLNILQALQAVKNVNFDAIAFDQMTSAERSQQVFDLITGNGVVIEGGSLTEGQLDVPELSQSIDQNSFDSLMRNSENILNGEYEGLSSFNTNNLEALSWVDDAKIDKTFDNQDFLWIKKGDSYFGLGSVKYPDGTTSVILSESTFVFGDQNPTPAKVENIMQFNAGTEEEAAFRALQYIKQSN